MLYFAVAALVVVLDQASKKIIWEIYKYSGGTDVIDGVLRVTLSKNTGAVMGILSGSKTLLLVITIISIA
ncbi:MAG: signal peptidase II, partial [Candidatus Krumholzibacteria bacterium]|nr:signal peptidase II [Candidatus Krumholzibacteria bacterium]